MWHIILGIGILFVLLEIFIPSMFFLNLALAAFVCAGLSFVVTNIPVLITIFCILSVIFILILRPIFTKMQNSKDSKTGIEEKYIGKNATVLEAIDKNSGVISIYDERWEARNIEDGIIEAGQKVQIINNESLIMHVKKID